MPALEKSVLHLRQFRQILSIRVILIFRFAPMLGPRKGRREKSASLAKRVRSPQHICQKSNQKPIGCVVIPAEATHVRIFQPYPPCTEVRLICNHIIVAALSF
jgi:hypothetical protein